MAVFLKKNRPRSPRLQIDQKTAIQSQRRHRRRYAMRIYGPFWGCDFSTWNFKNCIFYANFLKLYKGLVKYFFIIIEYLSKISI